MIAFIFAACSFMGEGEPVEPKKGIIGIWQSDANPKITMKYGNDGKGEYNNDGQPLTFKYNFTDNNTVKTTFPNGKSISYKVKTTERYLWLTDDNGTDRFHKM